MLRNPKHLRDRALDCLNLSKGARTEVDRNMLEEIAAELSAAAAILEAERAGRLWNMVVGLRVNPLDE